MQRFASRLKSDANKYFNCQFGNPPPRYTDQDNKSFNCPAGPGMKKPPGLKVDIDFVVQPKGTKPVKPFFYVHDCFRAEISYGRNGIKNGSDCKKVQQYSVNSCVKKFTSSQGYSKSVAKAACLRLYPLGAPYINRQNAANLTFSSHIGTLRHELFHQMGNNNDEYEDRQMQFNPLGETDSLMRTSKQSKPRLYPRHVRQVLSPLKCVKRRIR